MVKKPSVLVSVEIEDNKELFISVLYNRKKYSGYLKEIEEANI